MAMGVDDLADYVLAGIALLGVQGAGSKEFFKLLHNYYEESRQDEAPSSNLFGPNLPPEGLTRSFYEKVWDWVTDHPDIRICYKEKTPKLSLSEFEALEAQAEDGNSNRAPTDQQWKPSGYTPAAAVQPTPRLSDSLLSLGGSLRQRLLTDGCQPIKIPASQVGFGVSYNASSSTAQHLEGGLNDSEEADRRASQFPMPAGSALPTSAPILDPLDPEPRIRSRLRGPRSIPKGVMVTEPIFDEPPSSLAVPRLFASQNRVWQAVTGHTMDLKKVPAMEFVLLCIIATHRSDGITQPDLSKLSGQDKRSVPKRTDELARKGYISKKPYQHGAIHTSLCVHKKYDKGEDILYKPQGIDEVIGPKRFVLSGFIYFLHKLLAEVGGVVPMRELRKRLGVPVQKWHGRAVRAAIVRLSQTGMIKQVRTRRKGKLERYVICIKLLREPIEDDLKGYKSRRGAPGAEEANENLLEDDVEGDTFMRDMESELADEVDSDNGDGNNELDRIPPQWTPDRLLANMIVDILKLSRTDGGDSDLLRERTMGKFWKRPLESFVSRLTDDWERSQPYHLRHLAIIRDNVITKEKKVLHYVYRTYEYYKKAVKAGEVQTPRNNLDPPNNVFLDKWGFPPLAIDDFHGRTGSSTLVECRPTATRGSGYGPQWDNNITTKMGYQKPKKSHVVDVKPLNRTLPPTLIAQLQHKAAKSKHGKAKVTTQDKEPTESVASDANQSSPPLPPHVETSRSNMRISKGKPCGRSNPVPLLTMDERRSLGLPLKGRLGKDIEDKIRRSRGEPIKPTRPSKRRCQGLSEKPLLTIEQRVKMGLPRTGRLPGALVQELRRKRALGLSPDDPLPADEGSLGHGGKGGLELDDDTDDTDHVDEPVFANMSSLIPSIEHFASASPRSSTAKSKSLKRRAEGEGADPRKITKRVRLGSDVSEVVPQSGAVSAGSEASLLPAKRRLEDSISGARKPPKGLRASPHVPSSIRSSKRYRRTDASSPIPAAAATFSSTREQPLDDVEASDIEITASTPISDNLPDQPLSEAEMRIEQIKTKYAKRTEPGFYYNPFATRKTRRGRPPKVFLATFKSSRLHEFSWFASDPAAASGHFSPRLAAPSGVAIQSEPIDARGAGSEPIVMADAEAEVRANSPMFDAPDVEPAMTATRSTKPPALDELSLGPSGSIELQVETSTPSKTILDMVETSPIETSPAPVTKPQQSTNTPRGDVVSQQSSVTNVTQGSLVDTTLHQSRNSSESRQSPAGWSAINLPATGLPAPYQSPYSAPSLARSSPLALEIEETGAAPAPKEWSRSARRNGNSVGAGAIKLGSGSVQYTRTSIIKHILELCNGVFPGNGEIVPVFEGMWKERAPKKMVCPDRSTILKTFAAMIRDPAQNLRKTLMLVQSIEVEAPAKKYYIAFNHLANDSPEIRRMRSGISQAYPSRYFPPEVVQYVNPESKPNSKLPLEIDDTIKVDDLFPSRAKRLSKSIQELARLRNEDAKQKKLKKQEEAEQRKKCSIEVEKRQLAKINSSEGDAREKRIRLVGLDQRKRGRLPQVPPDLQDQRPRGNSPVPSDSSEDIPLSLLRPRHSLDESTSNANTMHDEFTLSSDAELSSHDSDGNEEEEFLRHTPSLRLTPQVVFERRIVTLLAPATYFYHFSGTFSTECHLSKEQGDSAADVAAKVAKIPINISSVQKKGRKRVRIAEPAVQDPPKKARRANQISKAKRDDLYVDMNEGSGRDILGPGRKRKRQKPIPLRDPTLVERLTGLTGNPNDPDYQPPTRKRGTSMTWAERKKRGRVREIPVKKYPESLDPVDRFKKLCCALVVASSMSGEEGIVDWDIIASVYSEDRSFDMAKIKQTWSWMQKHMTAQLHKLTGAFQSSFLDAYEEGTLASIEDPNTYDWANLVRWALHHCKYPEPSLPTAREALDDYEIDVSPFEVIDRPVWYKETLSSLNRTQRLLKYTYVAPLHQTKKPTTPAEEHALKARSWIRANISTPKALYDKKKAHDKLRPLGDSILGQVVSDFVEAKFLRLWKLKRLRPGRNYDFASAFAKNYRRPLELKDFMAAVKLKKNLDTAFAEENPEKRAFAMSRSADDGAVMAVMSLVGAGQVKLVPRLPPINSDFSAPLPRLSVWGMCEGDYASRHIDRQRLFWKIDVIPTPAYQFSNPLQPIPFPLAAKDDGSPADWQPLLEPPLPGRHSPDALLPIWSSIDGESVTWPWWNRILSLVLQTLIFQPGITAAEIFRHCPKHTTETFEIELVLDWLEAVRAVQRSDHGTYSVLPGFWAVFGDRLIGEEEDGFGEYVKRKATNKKISGPTWRSVHNLRYSTMQQAVGAGFDASTSEDEDDEHGTPAAQERTIKKPRKQYHIAKRAPETPVARRERASQPKVAAPEPRAHAQQPLLEPPIDPTLLSVSPTPPTQDVDMMDLTLDAGGEDVDAEGEWDDEFAISTSMNVGN